MGSLQAIIADEETDQPEYDQAMELISGYSYRRYRELAESDGLVDDYNAASPVDEVAWLNVGSRPARRFGPSH